MARFGSDFTAFSVSPHDSVSSFLSQEFRKPARTKLKEFHLAK
jgi:hypothetical protein